jgi:hypothetical protein
MYMKPVNCQRRNATKQAAIQKIIQASFIAAGSFSHAGRREYSPISDRTRPTEFMAWNMRTSRKKKTAKSTCGTGNSLTGT